MIPQAMYREKPLVLIVDDDFTIRLLLRETLEQEGFTVEEEECGDRALATFESIRPEMVLLDVLLPGLDGFSVCAAIRRLPWGENVPVLMMTGLDDVISITRAYEAGATDFITKPINWMILGQRALYMLRSSRTFDRMRRNEARLAQAQQMARIGNWDWDITRDKIYCSDEVHRLFGIEPGHADASQRSFLKCVHPGDREQVNRFMMAAIEEKMPSSFDHRLLLADGEVRHVHTEVSVSCLGNGGELWMMGTIQDISDRKRYEEQIRHLAYFDGLTGLPNRQLFKEQLEQTLAGMERSDRNLAILFLDLDRFKFVNDTLGHGAGDMLLQEVAERLKRSLRKSDYISHGDVDGYTASISRLGGDEFTVLLTNIVQPEAVAVVATRILGNLSEPYILDGNEVSVTVSIGISIYPADGQDVVTLIKNADTAMYHAKEMGKNNFQYYTRSLNESALKRLQMESHLRRALTRDEFCLHFQPQIDTSTDRMVGLEALIRWHDPEFGTISPADFIPLAEETGVIIAIDEWVITAACGQIRAWQEMGLEPVTVSINISGQHFLRSNLAATVARILGESGVDSALLEIELTEGVLMQNVPKTIETLNSLKKMGIRLSLDDFGTGYSSLSYLNRFPIDSLKIDRSFVMEIANDPDIDKIISAIIAMAHSLHIKVVAEGVETGEQLRFLAERGCSLMQGYYFSRPLPPQEIVARLLEQAEQRNPGKVVALLRP